MKMVPAPPPTMSSPMMSSNNHQQFEVTEDTPVDFLEGCMEILVIFPNEKSILMSIQRRMPMLDLLIHVTAANKISPAAHLLQVTDEEGRFLPHKPSTPIGSLNAHKVYIVSKNRLMSDRSGRSGNTKSSSTASSQFEQSFRVQVRLPRNQLFVTRVTGRTQLADLLHTVCNEKALDPRHYELRHPVNLDERLRLSSCLDDYKLQEVVLVPLGGKNPQTAVLSVHDLATMNKKTVAVTVSNSSSNMPGSSKMSGGKSTLRPTSSEATLAHAGHEKKKRGLFGLLGFGKSKKGSSMGDSSVSSDSAGDRSISPSRSEEPAPPAEPVAPSPPSPVLFSKRLAEEAVAKRNSRLMMSQMSSESTTPTTTTTNASAAAPSPLRNGMAPAKPAAKKKRAPAPPPPSSSTPPPGMNGPPPKAASEISSYSTSSSGSNAVSPSTSVIHHSETEMVHSPSPKLSYHRQESNLARRQPDSGSSSPMRPSSNLLTTPVVSSSNLTQVSSTSNASLASAIKKRKAPVPPPALDEQVEASEKTTTVVIVNGSHDDSDQASSVSDQMSSVSDMSSPRKSATPEVVEQPVVVERLHHHQQPSPELDSPRSSAASTSTKASSEDDYEVLNYQREAAENVENKTQSSSSYNQAQESEEVVVSEPIYTMVIKSPKIMKAVDWEPKGATEPAGSDQSDRTNDEAPVEAEPMAEPVAEQADKIEVVVKAGVMEEEEPVMERDAGDGQTESPVMWEYKLPAPPTPFQDSRESPLDKLQIQASASETNRSRHSSMSTDSLQHDSGDDDGEEIYQKDSLRSSILCPETPEVKEDDNQVAIKLERGVELLEETRTEEQPMDVSVIAEVEKEVVSKAEEEKVVVVLKSSDPEAKQYGIESTTDEPLPTQQQEVFLPPVPSTLPPSDSEDDSLQTEMRFSIATYNLRVSKDSTYEKKLRSISPEPAPANLTSTPIDPEKEVNDPVVPIVAEIKEPETVVEPVKVQVSGSAAVAATTQPSLPMINADFIQQFQNALHCIDDPKARTLQEEFLRLQQQLLSLQMQAAVQQSNSPAVSEPLATTTEDTTDRSPETIKIEEEVVVADVSKSKSVSVDLRTEVVVEAERIELESPAEIPFQQQQQKEEPEEPVVYRYTGPPQVKLDTWKPGRPRSEVIDYSRSSSFNVPLAAAVEKKAGEMPTAGTVSAVAATDVISSIPEEVVVRASPIPDEESKIKSVIIAEVEEMDVREKIEHLESSSPTSPSPKPVVLRKSSFLTARPFEARPVSMPIKRPSFTPMVIQPVPFVSRKIRAPEVRGFASLPPVTNENPPIRMAGPMVAPFSAVNKPRTVATVSKENPTIVIRNKLIESARRPSAELNGAPIKLIEEYSNQENTTTEVGKESSVIVAETRRNSSSSRPLSMPVSSSLLLAAGAGGAVNKTQPITPEIPNPPVPPPSTAQQSVVSGADPASTAAGRRSLSSKFVRKVDPREELLNSIRSFANGGTLRKTGASLDK